MKDIELYGRLKLLGMPAAKAWELTAKIRDELHPIAAIAAAKLHGAGGPARKGLGLNVTGGIQDASLGAKAGSLVPIVGTIVGGIIGGLIGSFFGPAKLGKASVTWNDMVQHGYLQQERGAQFDERYFGEALKGAMDEGNNVWPGCGADRHKSPDCFFGPMSQAILAGYTSGTVPVTANTATVFQSVVLPWLQSGRAGVNWGTLAHEPTQQLLLEAATDRYINGMPIVRGDMQAYAGQGYTTHEPSISAVLSQAQSAPTVSSSVATQPVASIPSNLVAQGSTLAAQSLAVPVAPAYASPIAATPVNTSANLLQSLLAQNGVGMTSYPAQNLVGQVAAQGVTQTAYGPAPGSASAMPSWLVPAGIAGVVAVKIFGAHKALS